MSSRVITPGPYRATKLWNEVTRLFRAGMPLKKHRHNFRHHSSCFTASAAVDWLHELLRGNSNFGPDVTRQQTLQLLKKFLKNHVIEDVKGRWGTEELEDSNALYRFPPTSPLKPIPCPAPGSSSSTIKKRPSLRDFRFRSVEKNKREIVENVDPALPAEACENQPREEQQRRELTAEDELEIWRDVTLTHLQRILGVPSLSDVLDPHHINPQNIIHNMTKVNKHGVVTLEDKTNDLPHWVLSAMKSLANWPKYDSAHPSYPGFERDVFKNVSDYFYSLPQPLLTYQLYELFINVLVFSGYVASANATRPLRKRKIIDPPCVPPPSKASFRSTECLLLSLLRHGTCDEADSPMKEVIGGKLQSRRLAAMKGGVSGGEEAGLGGSCASLSTVASSSVRPPTRSCSLETVLDEGAPLARQRLFLSTDSLASGSGHSNDPALPAARSHPQPSPAPFSFDHVPAADRLSGSGRRWRPARPRSFGSSLDIVMENQEEEGGEMKIKSRAASCLNVNAPDPECHAARPPWLSSSSYHLPSSSSHPLSSSSFSSAASKACPAASGPAGPRPASSTSNLCTLDAAPVVRRCRSSLDISKASRHASLLKAAICGPRGPKPTPQTHQPHSQHSVLRPQCERVAIEALQLCTLLLPPSSRRKLQLLMRMMSRISQNVDMPRLHPVIGTRTLMVHTFSCCVLGSAEECELDELLATRLVSFLMDHQHSVLTVPEYLLSAISDHIHYLRTAQVPVDSAPNGEAEEAACIPMPMYAFCRQISGPEFEQQKLEASQQAMEELLEILLRDQNLSQKERSKKLKQFQKQYPDIYRRRFPSSEGENKAEKKPKIKPALLNLKKTKTFSLRN